MPALPLFNILAPAPQASLNQPSSSPLSGYSSGFTPLKGVEGQADETFSSDSGLTFWQQLQAASEQLPLPSGQEIAAYLPQIVQPLVDDMPKDTSVIIAESESGSQVTLDVQGESGQALMASPLTTQPTIQSIAEQDSSDGLEYLESVRQAKPHVQTPQPVQTLSTPSQAMAASALAANVLLDAASLENADVESQMAQVTNLPLKSVLPLTESEVKPLTANQQAMNAAQVSNQPISTKIINTDELGEKPLFDELTQGMDSELTEDGQSIHEKPMTIRTQKEVGQEQGQSLKQETSFTQEVRPQAGELAGANLKDPQVNHKSAALDQVASQSTQGTEKNTAFNKLDVPPQHPQWNDQVAKRISIMASESIQTARIQLDPPELGALEVKIKVQHDQVSVSFGSNNQVVRDALEAQTPRLRELLEQQGVNLADVNVSEHGGQKGEQGSGSDFSGADDPNGIIAEDALETTSMTQLESNSLVDYFA